MKQTHTIKYESDGLLPEEIDSALRHMEKKIYENKYDLENIHVEIGRFKGVLATWLAEKSVISYLGKQAVTEYLLRLDKGRK